MKKYIGKRLQFRNDNFVVEDIKEKNGVIVIKTTFDTRVLTKNDFEIVKKDYDKLIINNLKYKKRTSTIIETIGKRNLEEFKVFEENDMYYIYKDGRVYSNWFKGKFLTPTEFKPRNRGVSHYAIGIPINGKRKAFQISRLVMFYFGKHNYKRIEDMPKIIFKDCNTLNFSLDNLIFAKKGDITRKIHKLYPESKAKIKSTETNINKIKSLINNGFTLKEIGKLFDTSEMSVVRFKQKNNI